MKTYVYDWGGSYGIQKKKKKIIKKKQQKIEQTNKYLIKLNTKFEQHNDEIRNCHHLVTDWNFEF